MKGLQTGPVVDNDPVVPRTKLLVLLLSPMLVVGFSFAGTQDGPDIFLNPENPRAYSPLGKTEIIVVDDPTTEGSCSQRQNDKCTTACAKQKKLMVSCDVSFEWQPDGSCTRTLLCSCASRPTAPQIALIQRADVKDIEIADPCNLEPVCSVSIE